MKFRKAAWVLDKSRVRQLLGIAPSWSGVLGLGYHRIGGASGSPFDGETVERTGRMRSRTRSGSSSLTST